MSDPQLVVRMDSALLVETAARLGSGEEVVLTTEDGAEIKIVPAVGRPDPDDRRFVAAELDGLTLDPDYPKPVSAKFFGRGDNGSGDTKNLGITREQYAAIRYVLTGA